MDLTPLPGGPAMLVVGHPGHELRVHGWLEATRPVVMVLTDGSGGSGVSRLPATAAALERAGATPGAIFGRLTDAAMYRALLDGRTALFAGLVDELAGAMAAQGATVVVADDAEGYNPTHDVCRLLVNAAVDLLEPTAARPIANLAVALTDRPDRPAYPPGTRVSRFELDDAQLARKLRAAECYDELAAEVASARQTWGDDAFRVEILRHAVRGERWTAGEDPPFYERHGEARVASGAYADVVRYDRHLRPLGDALAVHVRTRTR